MTKKKETIKTFKSSYGNEFTLQKCPSMTWLEMQERAMGANGARPTVLFPAILENIVVEPNGLKTDNFDNDEKYGGYGELKEVIEEASRFQQQ